MFFIGINRCGSKRTIREVEENPPVPPVFDEEIVVEGWNKEEEVMEEELEATELFEEIEDDVEEGGRK